MVRYRKLGYAALTVSDLARARDWYERIMGLQFNGAGKEGELYFRADADHHSLVLYQGGRPGLKRVGWQLESDARFEGLARSLDRYRVPWRELDRDECRAAHIERVIRMVEPVTGVTLDFYGSGMRQEETPFRPTVTRFQGLCHIGIGTPRYREAIDFYEQVLNFRTSDEIDGRINLMRCFPNPLHHSFAIASAARNTLHHLNFMVEGEEDMLAGRVRFKANDVPMVWDGYHPPSGNTFLFFLDPDGLSLEYGHGMELFPEAGARAPRVFPAVPESFDSTGSHRDERTAAVGEIENS